MRQNRTEPAGAENRSAEAELPLSVFLNFVENVVAVTDRFHGLLKLGLKSGDGLERVLRLPHGAFCSLGFLLEFLHIGHRFPA